MDGEETSSFWDMDMEALEVFDQILEFLFSVETGVVLVGGALKKGKTDFALLMVERLFELDLIKECATNIKTEDCRIAYIDNLPLLRSWLWVSPSSKVYVLDEGREHGCRRDDVIKKNVDLDILLHEISKVRVKMIIICQDPSDIEENFHDQPWLRGVAMKLSKTAVRLISSKFPFQQEAYTFYDVPRTTIGFNPYGIAPFKVKPTERTEIMHYSTNGHTESNFVKRSLDGSE